MALWRCFEKAPQHRAPQNCITILALGSMRAHFGGSSPEPPPPPFQTPQGKGTSFWSTWWAEDPLLVVIMLSSPSIFSLPLIFSLSSKALCFLLHTSRHQIITLGTAFQQQSSLLPRLPIEWNIQLHDHRLKIRPNPSPNRGSWIICRRAKRAHNRS